MNKKTVITLIALVLCVAVAGYLGIRLNQQNQSLQDTTMLLTEAQNQTSALEKEKAALSASLEAETQAKDSALAESAQLSDSLKASEAAVEEITAAREEALNSVASLSDSLKAAQDALAEETQAKVAALAENESLRAALTEAEAALTQNASEKEALEEARTALEAKLNEMTAAPAPEASAEPAEPEAQATGAENAGAPAETIAPTGEKFPDGTDEALSGNLTALGDQIETLETALQEAVDPEKLAELTAQIDTLQTSLQEATDALAAEKEFREKLEEENAQLTLSLQDTQTRLETALQDLETASEQNRELTDKLTATEESLKSEQDARSAAETALAEEKEAHEAVNAALSEAEAALAEELEKGAALAEEKETLTATLAEASEKADQLAEQVTDLTEKNENLQVQTEDLRGNNVLAEQLPEAEPAPRMVPVQEETAKISWCRLRYNEEGYPQLWVDVRDEKGIVGFTYYRKYVDKDNTEQQEVYEHYILDGKPAAVRYRTLRLPGSYSLVVTRKDLEKQDFGRLVTLEDVDGNGIVDTLTDWKDDVTLLEIPNAFSVKSGD